MTTVIVDYESGNLHSAEKAFQRMAAESGAGTVSVTSDPDVIRRADRIVLPGDGAFPSCRAALFDHRGVFEAMEEVVRDLGRPFFGICIGMQMLATRGHEYKQTPGFDWIPGEVRALQPSDAAFKVPHMGWNDLSVDSSHPVLKGVTTGDHAYFVHSYQLHVDHSDHLLAYCEYAERVTAVVGHGTVFGTQFHPEKSQATGLRIISNFLTWAP